MNKSSLTGALLVLLALLVACAGQIAPPHDGPPPPPTLPELTPGEWTAFSPGGETGCADGTPYTFYVRPGTVNKVVVDFEGGGACWSGATCGREGPFQPDISSSSSPGYREDSPSGLYDHANPQNPVGTGITSSSATAPPTCISVTARRFTRPRTARGRSTTTVRTTWPQF